MANVKSRLITNTWNKSSVPKIRYPFLIQFVITVFIYVRSFTVMDKQFPTSEPVEGNSSVSCVKKWSGSQRGIRHSWQIFTSFFFKDNYQIVKDLENMPSNFKSINRFFDSVSIVRNQELFFATRLGKPNWFQYFFIKCTKWI